MQTTDATRPDYPIASAEGSRAILVATIHGTGTTHARTVWATRHRWTHDSRAPEHRPAYAEHHWRLRHVATLGKRGPFVASEMPGSWGSFGDHESAKEAAALDAMLRAYAERYDRESGGALTIHHDGLRSLAEELADEE